MVCLFRSYMATVAIILSGKKKIRRNLLTEQTFYAKYIQSPQILENFLSRNVNKKKNQSRDYDE